MGRYIFVLSEAAGVNLLDDTALGINGRRYGK